MTVNRQAPDDFQAIAACILDCARARDHRGRWRQERALTVELLALGDTPRMAAATAAAVRAIGAAISNRAQR